MHILFAEHPGFTKPLNSGENHSQKTIIVITAKIHAPIYPALLETLSNNEPPIPTKSIAKIMLSITEI